MHTIPTTPDTTHMTHFNPRNKLNLLRIIHYTKYNHLTNIYSETTHGMCLCAYLKPSTSWKAIDLFSDHSWSMPSSWWRVPADGVVGVDHNLVVRKNIKYVWQATRERPWKSCCIGWIFQKIQVIIRIVELFWRKPCLLSIMLVIKVVNQFWPVPSVTPAWLLCH